MQNPASRNYRMHNAERIGGTFPTYGWHSRVLLCALGCISGCASAKGVHFSGFPFPRQPSKLQLVFPWRVFQISRVSFQPAMLWPDITIHQVYSQPDQAAARGKRHHYHSLPKLARSRELHEIDRYKLCA